MTDTPTDQELVETVENYLTQNGVEDALPMAETIVSMITKREREKVREGIAAQRPYLNVKWLEKTLRTVLKRVGSSGMSREDADWLGAIKNCLDAQTAPSTVEGDAEWLEKEKARKGKVGYSTKGNIDWDGWRKEEDRRNALAPLPSNDIAELAQLLALAVENGFGTRNFWAHKCRLAATALQQQSDEIKRLQADLVDSDTWRYKLSDTLTEAQEELERVRWALKQILAIPKTATPHSPAAFINTIAEEGTKDEAVKFLQEGWNELCAAKDIARAALQPKGTE